MAHFQNKIQFLKPRHFPTFRFPQDKAFSWCIQQEWPTHCSANEDTHDKLRNILMDGVLQRWSSWLEQKKKPGKWEAALQDLPLRIFGSPFPTNSITSTYIVCRSWFNVGVLDCAYKGDVYGVQTVRAPYLGRTGCHSCWRIGRRKPRAPVTLSLCLQHHWTRLW